MNAFGADLEAGVRHYLDHGRSEGRTTTFNAMEYLASNADVLAVYGLDEESAAQHYIQYGRFEGRTATFSAEAYLQRYADVRAAYGTDKDAAARHYILHGQAEGRTGSTDFTAPEVTVASIGLTNDNTPLVTGTASLSEVGRTVSLFSGETLLGTGTVGPDGTWSVMIAANNALADGAYTFTARVTDAVGNQGQGSGTVTIDTTAPTLTISKIALDDVLNKSEATSGDLSIAGTTSGVEEGRQVSVTLNGKIYTGTVSNNAWTVTIAAADIAAIDAAADTTYTLTADVSDLTGNAAVQATKLLKVDTTAPEVTINPISVDNVADLAEITAGFTISGTTTGVEEGQLVTLASLKAPVAADGTWNFSIPSATPQVLAQQYGIDISLLLSGQAVPVPVSVSVADAAGNSATYMMQVLVNIPTFTPPMPPGSSFPLPNFTLQAVDSFYAYENHHII